MDKCDSDPRCVAWNSDGWLKASIIPNTSSFGRCLYVKTSKRCQAVEGYAVTTDVNPYGNNIRNADSAAATQCSTDTSCLGFNSDAWLKSSLAPTSYVRGWCIYTKLATSGRMALNTVLGGVSVYTFNNNSFAPYTSPGVLGYVRAVSAQHGALPVCVGQQGAPFDSSAAVVACLAAGYAWGRVATQQDTTISLYYTSPLWTVASVSCTAGAQRMADCAGVVSFGDCKAIAQVICSKDVPPLETSLNTVSRLAPWTWSSTSRTWEPYSLPRTVGYLRATTGLWNADAAQSNSFLPLCMPVGGAPWVSAVASFTCRAAGFVRGRPATTADTSGGFLYYTSPIDQLRDVVCPSGAQQLKDCEGTLVQKGNCTAIAAVVCENGDGVRLGGGQGPWEGRVEVRDPTGRWGSICDTGWSATEAAVVCRSLGYSTDDAEAMRGGAFGPAPGGTFLMDHVDCTRSWVSLQARESSNYRFSWTPDAVSHISLCLSLGWGINSCEAGRAAGVRCRPPDGRALPPLNATSAGYNTSDFLPRVWPTGMPRFCGTFANTLALQLAWMSGLTQAEFNAKVSDFDPATRLLPPYYMRAPETWLRLADQYKTDLPHGTIRLVNGLIEGQTGVVQLSWCGYLGTISTRTPGYLHFNDSGNRPETWRRPLHSYQTFEWPWRAAAGQLGVLAEGDKYNSYLRNVTAQRAAMVCHRLGYTNSRRKLGSRRYPSPSEGLVFDMTPVCRTGSLDRVRFRTSIPGPIGASPFEQDLVDPADCPHFDIKLGFGSHREDLSVDCWNEPEELTPPLEDLRPDGTLRLMTFNTTSRRWMESTLSGKGYVQVLYGFGWGWVCRDGWSQAAAAATCRQLGYAAGRPETFLFTDDQPRPRNLINMPLPQPTRRYWLTQVSRCALGADNLVEDCSFTKPEDGSPVTSCSYFNMAAVACYTSTSLAPASPPPAPSYRTDGCQLCIHLESDLYAPLSRKGSFAWASQADCEQYAIDLSAMMHLNGVDAFRYIRPFRCEGIDTFTIVNRTNPAFTFSGMKACSAVDSSESARLQRFMSRTEGAMYFAIIKYSLPPKASVKGLQVPADYDYEVQVDMVNPTLGNPSYDADYDYASLTSTSARNLLVTDCTGAAIAFGNAVAPGDSGKNFRWVDAPPNAPAVTGIRSPSPPPRPRPPPPRPRPSLPAVAAVPMPTGCYNVTFIKPTAPRALFSRTFAGFGMSLPDCAIAARNNAFALLGIDVVKNSDGSYTSVCFGIASGTLPPPTNPAPRRYTAPFIDKEMCRYPCKMVNGVRPPYCGAARKGVIDVYSVSAGLG